MGKDADSSFLNSLHEVLSELKDEKGLPYPHGIFLPHVMNGYKTAPLKIFYYGLDTRTWMGDDATNRWGYQVMMDHYHSGQLDEYITKNNAWPKTKEDILAWGNTIAFWPFVIRLHLLMTKGEFPEDLKSMPTHLLDAIMTFGYGNVYPIEKKESLKKEKWQDGDVTKTCWDAITNRKAYEKATRLAQEKILFKDVLELFSPDCVFIHTWGWKEKDFFKGLNWHQHELCHEGKWAAYTIEGYKTKILCMPHPNSRGFPFKETIHKAADIMKRWLSTSAS